MDRLTKYSNKTYHENGVCCTHFRSEECRALVGDEWCCPVCGFVITTAGRSMSGYASD